MQAGNHSLKSARHANAIASYAEDLYMKLKDIRKPLDGFHSQETIRFGIAVNAMTIVKHNCFGLLNIITENGTYYAVLQCDTE